MEVLSLAITGPFVSSPVAGATVDRTKRKPVLVATDLGRALLIALLPITFALGLQRLELVYLVGTSRLP